jgi:hypothetical protein
MRFTVGRNPVPSLDYKAVGRAILANRHQRLQVRSIGARDGADFQQSCEGRYCERVVGRLNGHRGPRAAAKMDCVQGFERRPATLDSRSVASGDEVTRQRRLWLSMVDRQH